MAKFDITIQGTEESNPVVSVFTVEAESMSDSIGVFEADQARAIEYPFIVTGIVRSVETDLNALV